MNKITFRLPTAVALLINLVGMGLAPLPSAAAPATQRLDVENGASFGVLPGWFSTTSDNLVRATDEESYTDDRGRYIFEGLPHGTHKVTIHASTLPPDLLPDEGESAPVLWLTPGQSQTSEALSTGVRFTAIYDWESGAIAGMVFLDQDGDGQPGPGEPGIPGVRVVDPTVHQYFVPFRDQDLWTLFEGKAQCNGTDIGQVLVSYVFLTSGSDGTIYYYDHWEDGYDADPLNPGTTTEVAMVDSGVSQIFQSDIITAQIGTGPPFYYDGRDRITIFGEDAVVVRLVYPEDPGTVLAGAWEVPEAASWGTEYVATVGEDLAFTRDHEYTGLEVVAWQDGTDIYYNGSLVDTIDAGGVYFREGAADGAGSGGVDSSDTITATAPVQVQMMTGACGGAWSAHGYTLQPVGLWDKAYWAPVPGFASSPLFCDLGIDLNVDTDVYLHNPQPYPITITVSSDNGTFDISVPPATTVSVLQETPWADISSGNSGAYLSSTEIFWGLAVVDSSTNGATQAQTYDWGYALIPAAELSSQVIVGYAPGNGEVPATAVNGNLAFVTAVTDTVIYVDLTQDGLPDPFDMNGDGDVADSDVWGEAVWDEPLSALGIPLQAGQVLRVGDPYDYNLIGAMIYTTNLLDKIAVAWGQDPCPADRANPYLDLGYTTLPVPIPRLSKVDELAIDADLSGGVSPGDTISYSLVLHNNGLGSMNDVVLTDTLPYTYTDLVVSSLQISTPPPTDTVDYYDGVSWGTDPISDARMLRVTWDTIGPGQTVTVSFRVRLDTMIPVTVTQITNQAVVDSTETRATQSEDPEDPTDPPTDTPVDRPLLSIDKRVSPAIVRPGGRITYTVVVSNYGNGVALLATITDVLPSWIEYVPGTLDLTWPIAHVEVTTRAISHTSAFHGYYADDFDLTVTQTTLYTGNDGSLAWSGDWLEVNDLLPLGPSTGYMQVGTVVTNALSVPAYLTMTNSDVGIRRTADLADFRGPWLRYYVAGETNAADDQYVAEAGTVSLSEWYSGGYTLRELDLSAISGTLATLHYTATSTLDPDDHYRFDNIAIYETDPERSAVEVLTWERTVLSYTTSTGGDPVSYDPLTGHIVFTDGKRLPPGGFITITFQAQVAIPLTDGLTLTNTACVTSLNWLEHLSPPCDEASVQVLSSHALTVSKTADPTPVEAGGLLTYTIHYTITGDEAVTSVVISDTTPQHTTFYTATPVPDIYPVEGGVGPVIWRMSGLWPPGSGITQSFGTVTLVVLVDSVLISGTTVFNSVIVTDTTGLTTTGTTTTPVNVIADVSVLKTDSHDPVAAGWILTYTLLVNNAGPSDAQDVAVTDTLPVEVTFLDATPPYNYSPPDHSIVWDLGTIAAGETRPLTVVVRVQSWVTDTFTNTVVVATSTPESNYGNNTATEPTDVGEVTDVTIAKTDDVDPVAPGDPLVYTLVYTNNGPSDAENVVVSDTLPVEVVFVDADPGQASGPNPLVWNLGTVAAGAGGTIRVTVTVESWVTQTFTNPVSISTSSPESNYGNNTATEPTDVLEVADVTIAKSDDVDPVVPGNPLVYTLVYTNNGPLDAENVVVSDTLPVEVLFEDADPGQTSGPNPLVWDLGTVAAGAGGTIRVTVTVESWVTQTFTNPVSISTSSPESNYGNNTATEPTDVLGVADVTIAKTDDVDPVVPGEPLVYTLVYTNNGPLDAENVVVSDTLPVEVLFVGADPGQASGPNPLVWNLGTVAAGAGGTIRVTVTVESWVTQTFTNPVSISTSTPESNYGNNTATEPTTPLVPGLAMAKTVEPCRVVPNMPFTYTIRITNTGGLTLTTLVLTDTLPPDFNYVVGSGQPTDPDVLAEPTLVWSNLGPLAPAETLNVSFAVTVTPGVTGSFVNMVVVSSTLPVGVITGTTEVSVCVEMPAVALDKRVTRWDRNNDVITFSIAITNVGPSTLDIIPLMDDYDFRFLSFSDAVPEPDEGDDDGLLSWYDLTGPPPNGFGRNLIPGARFVVTTVFNVVGDFTSTVNTAIISGVVDVHNNPTGKITDSVEIINIPTGIELLDLRATGHESGVLVEWATLIEVDAYGFWIYRALLEQFDQASQIAFQPKEGNLVGAQYTYLDQEVTLGQQYWYWLVGVSNEGHQTRYGPVSATAGAVSVGQHRTYLPIVIRSE
jgi:uncharacterized repeat protein (TIGR01451 family)